MLAIHAHSPKLWANFNAVLRWSLASELRYLVHGHGKPKATMPSVKIAKRGLCWEYWGLALTKPGCVFDLEAKTRSSFPSGERTRKDECARNVDRLNRVENILSPLERSFTKKNLTFVATGSCLTLSSFGNKKFKKKEEEEEEEEQEEQEEEWSIRPSDAPPEPRQPDLAMVEAQIKSA